MPRKLRRVLFVAVLVGWTALITMFGVRHVVHNRTGTRAVLDLLLLRASQDDFRERCAADTDSDGVGEYGTLRELAGLVGVRQRADGSTDGSRVFADPVLGDHLATLDALGRATGEIYAVQVYLPGEHGLAVPEEPTSATRSLRGTVDADLAERLWCAYAWPLTQGDVPRRTFFVGVDGAILATTDARYVGTPGPPPGAAFMTGGMLAIWGVRAIGTAGQDGNVWEALE